MKRLSLLFLLLALTGISKAQWTDGATWVYEFASAFGPVKYLHVYQINGDTICNGTSYKKLNCKLKFRDPWGSDKVETEILPSYPVYFVNNSVYVIYNGKPENLYVFYASEGDKFAYNEFGDCTEKRNVQVYSTESLVYRGTPVNKVNTRNESSGSYAGSYYNDIGGHYDLLPLSSCAMEGPIGQGLLCFRHIGHQIGTDHCEDTYLETMSVNEFSANEAKVLVDGQNISISLTYESNYSVEIVDITGRAIGKMDFSGTSTTLPAENHGLTLIRITDKTHNKYQVSRVYMP